MGKALSIDLRERVIAAVNEGTSRREAAVRFGVSASSAIRWCALERETGDPRSKPQGGDRRSARIEAEASRILALVEERPDITLAELQAKLAKRGLWFSISAIWRFFARRRITFKKSPRTRQSRNVLTS
jgi:transposase